MKTTLDLPEMLMREAKLRAAARGVALKDLVADFIRQGLGQPLAAPLQSSLVTQNAAGLPVVLGSASGCARGMSVDDMLALEQSALASHDLAKSGL